jgi:hypothetical protein
LADGGFDGFAEDEADADAEADRFAGIGDVAGQAACGEEGDEVVVNLFS